MEELIQLSKIINNPGWLILCYISVEIIKYLRSKNNLSIREMQIQILQLQLLFMCHYNPENTQAILYIYDKYKKMGGNSYVEDVISEWRKKHG